MSAGPVEVALPWCGATSMSLRRSRPAATSLSSAGTLMSAGRVMQGAHFASHNLWTLLFDWTICLACYRLLLYRRAATPAPGIVATAAT